MRGFLLAPLTGQFLNQLAEDFQDFADLPE